MKKVAVIPAVVLAALCTFTGCKKEEVEKVIAPLVSDGQTTESTEEAQEEKDPLIPEIDTSVELQAGSRVAVVSKSTSGEFWGLVKKGMEQAIADALSRTCLSTLSTVLSFNSAAIFSAEFPFDCIAVFPAFTTCPSAFSISLPI